MTNIYTTRGTADFMEQVKKKYPDEGMILMHGSGTSLLIHETEGKSVFQTPHRYEVIAELGQLQDQGFFAMNNVPVSDEGKPVFEDQFKKNYSKMADAQGFVAYRLLRPIGSDTYVILTEWTDARSFDTAQHTDAFKEAYDTSQADALAGPAIHMFTSAPYLSLYSSFQDKDA
ncbi:heme-degrading monooxygenase HmoB [Sporosarcina sp. NCCP-2716]|uniref:antibiotic biosynthesis monooxygenase family protein n=1 Tax=Sporosarcina sp. NCCP-2716 TaxID=2943679 RepID=UPI00203F394C|nr:antibiotic biosynthesis monooxygenase [Sporosarcina sp. NCCP-2716]GKV69376.1 heme-degrading monooxygenase HmoB [Sporosarcina sp. NCCP-2716]